MIIRGGFGRFEKVQAVAVKLACELRKRGVVAVYLFGSVARGEDGSNSDFDIAIEISPSHEGFDAWDLGWVYASFQELLEDKVDLIELSGISREMRRRITPDLRRLL